MPATATATASAPDAPAVQPATGYDDSLFDPKVVDRVRRRMMHPLLFRGFLLAKLPLALVAGLRVRALDRRRCVCDLPYGWRSQNPFRSIYFAAQAMAAEMSTGALAMLAVRSATAPVALLIVGLEAEFGKKATARTAFTCEGGDLAFAAVAATVATGEPATARLTTVGRMADGTEVARFTFTWSFKRRTPGRPPAA